MVIIHPFSQEATGGLCWCAGEVCAQPLQDMEVYLFWKDADCEQFAG